MNRIHTEPRENWQQVVERQGFHFHTAQGQPYWNESAYYQFSAAEIDILEASTYELNRIGLLAVEHVLGDPDQLGGFNVPSDAVEFIRASWETDEITIIGRLDLAYDGSRPPKLLEFNADTPTGLLEAAVIQWQWLKDVHPESDQFNSIHERLIEAWKRFKHAMPARRQIGAQPADMMYFSSMDNIEDFMTVSYLQDTAVQAGLNARYIQCDDIGWHDRRAVFTDLDENQINQIFKLYPWEWLLQDAFGPHVQTSPTRWLEAPWKMILANKAILPVLWQLFPDHPNLLPASFAPIEGPSVRKPVNGREGANIRLESDDHNVVETAGKYDGPCIYQTYQKLPTFDGNHAVIGSWIVNGYACGIGVREDESLITGNLSRFVPHLFK